MADTGSSSSIGGLLAALGGLKVHDASPTIDADMPMWFMYEAPDVTPLFGHAEAGAAANRLALSEHTGTHVDAPFHFDADGLTDRPGPGRRDAAAAVLQVRPQARRPSSRATSSALEHLRGRRAAAASSSSRATSRSSRSAGTQYLPGGANEPARRRWWGPTSRACPRTLRVPRPTSASSAVACDTAACDVAARDGEILGAHGHIERFLPHGILIVEGLTGLADVPATGLFLALPLKIDGGTGSPVRVVLLTD